MTTHAVLKKNKPGEPVVLEYNSIQSLLDELQLPKQRTKEIKEQLECYSGSTFVFKEKITKQVNHYLFEEMFDDDEIYGNVTATIHSTGVIPFFESMQYIDIEDERASVNKAIVELGFLIGYDVFHRWDLVNNKIKPIISNRGTMNNIYSTYMKKELR